MDSLAFRLANALVGNDSGAAGLEITLSGKSQHPLSSSAMQSLYMLSVARYVVHTQTPRSIACKACGIACTACGFESTQHAVQAAGVEHLLGSLCMLVMEWGNDMSSRIGHQTLAFHVSNVSVRNSFDM